MSTRNPERELASEFVCDTGCNLFLTGRAGTGKTTFLCDLKTKTSKRMVVTAPTGVAAINAGGVTLHSFFQLPFGPFVPGSKNTRSQYRFSRTKIELIKSLDLLVIDEISMVRADLLDGVDGVLRRYRRNDQPFGGVQLLMIGDLFQLPPVATDEDWQILQPYYACPYFFSSNALGKTEMVTIELTHIYRQSDNHFIRLLNRVRNDTVDATSLAKLNARHIALDTPKERDGAITLSTHNRNADQINTSRLKALKGKLRTFSAKIEGEFPVHAYPTASVLTLKKGAQVMFVRNDRSPEKRYFNGKIGRVTRIGDQAIRIQCPDDSEEIAVAPETWENIAYSLDKESLEINEKLVGGFTQYPLRLAWAITIHKSQGLTFDRAIIDAQAAFAHGQVYVALSRCRTLEGMMLSKPLPRSAMKVDPAILDFSQKARRNQPTKDRLKVEKINYQEGLLEECFDFQQLRDLLRKFVRRASGRAGLIQVKGTADLSALEKACEDEIFAIGDKFIFQLKGLFSPGVQPTDNPAVLNRIKKASRYFQEKLRGEPGESISQLQLETDNKTLKKKADFLLMLLQEEMAVKLAAVQSCRTGFSPSGYFRALSAGAVYAGDKKEVPVAPSYDASDIAHSELYETLKTWRSAKAKAEGLAHYQVLHQKTLVQIAVCLPDTLTELSKVRGIGTQLAKRYGEELVAMVGDYRKKRDITSVVLPPPSKIPTHPVKARSTGNDGKMKIDTKQASLDLFKKGMTLQQIAEARGLVLSTIEGHMVVWVQQGVVEIDRLVPAKKQKSIERMLLKREGQKLSDIKQALGNDFSYGEIKLVLAHMDRQSGR